MKESTKKLLLAIWNWYRQSPYKTWIEGAISAFLSGVGTSIAAWSIDSKDFNMSTEGIFNLLRLALVVGLMNFGAYIKDHNKPWDGVDRRKDGQ